jgi:alpha/beta superfamily hydrolase
VTDDITPEPTTLATADGVTLEAEVARPAAAGDATPWVVLCHPHPQQGGDMRSLVTSELFRTLPGDGISVLRFNFRGVGGSGGEHGHGVAEQLDLVAALDAVAGRAAVPSGRIVVAGWSFGADVSLAVADARIGQWVAIAPPLRIIDPGTMAAATDPRPKLLVVPEHDQFDPPDRVRETTAAWVATTIEVVAGADHFLVGRTDQVRAAVAGAARAVS